MELLLLWLWHSSDLTDAYLGSYDFFFSCAYYEKALTYYECDTKNSESMEVAGRIRLGHMPTAPLQEQLKGIEIYEKLLGRLKSGEDKKFYAYKLAKLLYQRAATSSEYKQAASYIVEYARATEQDITKHRTERLRLLLRKIWYALGDYDAIINCMQDHGLKHASDCYVVVSALLMRKSLSLPEALSCYCSLLERTESALFKARLLREAARIMSALRSQRPKMRVYGMGDIIDVMQEAKNKYGHYLSKIPHVNHYRAARIGKEIEDLGRTLDECTKQVSYPHDTIPIKHEYRSLVAHLGKIARAVQQSESLHMVHSKKNDSQSEGRGMKRKK